MFEVNAFFTLHIVHLSQIHKICKIIIYNYQCLLVKFNYMPFVQEIKAKTELSGQEFAGEAEMNMYIFLFCKTVL